MRFVFFALFLASCVEPKVQAPKISPDLEELADHVEMGCRAGALLRKDLTFEQTLEFCAHVRKVYTMGHVSEDEFRNYMNNFEQAPHGRAVSKSENELMQTVQRNDRRQIAR